MPQELCSRGQREEYRHYNPTLGTGRVEPSRPDQHRVFAPRVTMPVRMIAR